MVKTENFKTKTEFKTRANESADANEWVVALDIGYSAVKLYSNNAVCRFPSYARRVNKDFQTLSTPPEYAIMYEDLDTNEMWIVGQMANDMITASDTNESENALYGRERYYNPMFKVIANVGLALGMRANEYGDPNGKEIIVQTGLPERYLKKDSAYIKDILVGQHNFRVKIGASGWITYSFNLTEDKVFIMSQPKGTLFSIAINSDGTWHPDAKKYLESSILIFDPGFGTLDLFPVIKSVPQRGETFDDLGMKRVFQETVNSIYEKDGVEIPVYGIQNALSEGTYTKVDRKRLISEKKPFADILDEANKKVFNEAIERLNSVIDIFNYDYLVNTGGTGAAWSTMLRERLSGLSTLEIIEGNQNDELSNVYNNVRGYFSFRAMSLKSKKN